MVPYANLIWRNLYQGSATLIRHSLAGWAAATDAIKLDASPNSVSTMLHCQMMRDVDASMSSYHYHAMIIIDDDDDDLMTN